MKLFSLQYGEFMTLKAKPKAQQVGFSLSALARQNSWVTAFEMGRQSFAELLTLLPCDHLARNHLDMEDKLC